MDGVQPLRHRSLGAERPPGRLTGINGVSHGDGLRGGQSGVQVGLRDGERGLQNRTITTRTLSGREAEHNRLRSRQYDVHLRGLHIRRH